jgi:hypothetical protein
MKPPRILDLPGVHFVPINPERSPLVEALGQAARERGRETGLLFITEEPWWHEG